jgi:hypothetical protein
VAPKDRRRIWHHFNRQDPPSGTDEAAREQSIDADVRAGVDEYISGAEHSPKRAVNSSFAPGKDMPQVIASPARVECSDVTDANDRIEQ